MQCTTISKNAKAALLRPSFTPEQRAAAQAAAAAKRARFSADAHLYKTNYLDAPRWREMASAIGLRMPPELEPCSVSRMRTFLNRLGLPAVDFCLHYGFGNLSEFISKNPRWTLFGFVGTALELKANISGGSK